MERRYLPLEQIRKFPALHRCSKNGSKFCATGDTTRIYSDRLITKDAIESRELSLDRERYRSHIQKSMASSGSQGAIHQTQYRLVQRPVSLLSGVWAALITQDRFHAPLWGQSGSVCFF